MTITYELFQAGYCVQKANIVLRDEAKRDMKFPGIFTLLKHPTKGYILFDTGYSERFYEATKKFPYSIYKKVTPTYIKKKESAVEQLGHLGITPKDIPYIFISHFHADHIAGLKDFPHSQFICSKRGYHAIKNRTGLLALKAGYLPSLLPEDFSRRMTFIEDQNQYQPTQAVGDKKTFCQMYTNIYDIFADGMLLAVDVSGHAEGQFGLYFTSKKENVFLIADAVWRSRSYRENIYPKSIAKLIMSNPKEYKRNFDKIHQLHQLAPKMKLIPSHSEEVLQKEVEH